MYSFQIEKKTKGKGWVSGIIEILWLMCTKFLTERKLEIFNQIFSDPLSPPFPSLRFLGFPLIKNKINIFSMK